MSIQPTTKSVPTDEELMALPKDGYKRELVNGEIVMSPAGYYHGFESADLTITLGSYVRAKKLGQLVDGQTGFKMANGDVLCPDVSFVSTSRLPEIRLRKGFYKGAPDLAVEFLSPSESKKHVNEKVTSYLANGARLVWVADPQKRTVVIHHSDSSSQTLTETEVLTGEDVVPGFSISVKELFDGSSD